MSVSQNQRSWCCLALPIITYLCFFALLFSFVRSYYSASKDLDDKSAAIITACINRGLKCFHNCSDENFYKSTVKGSVFEAMAGVNVTILACK